MPTPSSDSPFAATGEKAGEQHRSGDPRPDLAALYAEVTSRHGDREGCPAADVLLDFLNGALPTDQRLEIVRHLADCSDCSEEVQSLRDRPSARNARDRAARLQVHERPLLRWSMLAAAAGLLLTFAIGMWQARLAPAPSPDDAPARLRSTAAGVSEVGVTSPAPNESMAEAPLQLRWPSGPEGPQERVRILNGRGDVIVDRASSSPGSVRLEPETRETLARGGRFVWTVDRTDGSRVGPHWFLVQGSDDSPPSR